MMVAAVRPDEGLTAGRAAEPHPRPKFISGHYGAQLGFAPGRVNQLFIGSWTGVPTRVYSEAVCHLKAEERPTSVKRRSSYSAEGCAGSSPAVNRWAAPYCKSFLRLSC